METAPAGACAVGPAAAASPARRVGVGVVVAVVGGRHFVADVGEMSSRVEFFSCWNRGAMRFVTVVVMKSVYILFASVRGTVGAVHRTRVGWCRGVAGIRRSVFSCGVSVCRLGSQYFYRYGSLFSRSIVVRFEFRVGLEDRVR